VKQILDEYQGKVRLVYRHFPLRSIHPQAQKAAEASECANNQGKFWEMHDKLFEFNNAGTLTLENMKKAAADLKLNTSTFNTCLDNGETADRVEQDYQDGIAGGVRGTPGTFINGQYIAGALPFEQIKPVIDSLL
jgi:protein-disulfide isomerase